MLKTTRSYRGMVTAPHHIAAKAGLRVLEDGGNAIENMVAAAAVFTVVYPHMNALGGENFWLIHVPESDVIGIDACGAAAAGADIEFYKNQGCDTIPSRGELAALTVAGHEVYNLQPPTQGLASLILLGAVDDQGRAVSFIQSI
jgi:gamma-glutamyltranspeptidase/glutathione hydrolase